MSPEEHAEEIGFWVLAGSETLSGYWELDEAKARADIAAAIRAAVAEEREACAQMADVYVADNSHDCFTLAAAIRARAA